MNGHQYFSQKEEEISNKYMSASGEAGLVVTSQTEPDRSGTEAGAYLPTFKQGIILVALIIGGVVLLTITKK